MRRLTIVYHYFAHYRRPVLNQLFEKLSTEYEIELLSDCEANLPALKTISAQEYANEPYEWTRVKNIWLGPWLWQAGLIGQVIRSRSDVFIFLGQINFLSTWVAIVVARIMGKKTYFWTHGVYGNEGFIKKSIRVAFYKLANGVFLYGEYARGLLASYGVDRQRLHVIYNSLDYEQQRHLREEKQPSLAQTVRRTLFGEDSEGTPYIVFVGRLTAIKRLDLLIEAVWRINEEMKVPVNCLIVGEGPEHESLAELARTLGIEHSVKFFGECHDENVLSELVYAADVCIAPGNVGLTAMHSLVYGTPVITHGDACWQMPEFEAITEGVNGGFFEKGNAQDLAEKTNEWLNRCVHARSEVRYACFKVVDEKYNPANQAHLIAEVIGSESKNREVD
jgi:glycosyltransferase involved in cell wall biosynthesis